MLKDINVKLIVLENSRKLFLEAFSKNWIVALGNNLLIRLERLLKEPRREPPLETGGVAAC